MSVNRGWKRNFSVIAVFVGVWLCLRYLFPFFLPFLLGLSLAVFSEPGTKFFQRSLRWTRRAASFASVTLTLAAILGAVWLSGALLLRQAAGLARTVSGAAEQMTEGVQILKDWAVELSSHAPTSLEGPLRTSVESLFTDGGGLLDRGAEVAFDLAGHAAQRLPGSLITLGTALLASYMMAAQLPSILSWIAAHPVWRNRWYPALRRLRTAAAAWFKAQIKLSAVTFAIVLGGYFLLGVRNKLPLALLTAAVDAVPLLGTGTVLLPWALVSLLSAEPVRAVGLLGIYVTAFLVRSTLEPKLVGRQLGLNPLTALMALYAGYRFWGFGGMILAPILTVTARELARSD